MTNVVALVRAWLAANPGIAALTSDRISSTLDPADGFPAIQIGTVTGSPRSTPRTGVDVVEDWSVAIYCYGGRLAGQRSDLPDTQAAWALARAVAEAVADISEGRHSSTAADIVSARVVSASPTAVDPDTNSARATVTLALQVWRTA